MLKWECTGGNTALGTRTMLATRIALDVGHDARNILSCGKIQLVPPAPD